jgi:hypothetical protein
MPSPIGYEHLEGQGLFLAVSQERGCVLANGPATTELGQASQPQRKLDAALGEVYCTVMT